MRNIHIFDLDGTLIDSMYYWSRKMLRILEQEGIPYGDDLLRTITPLGDLGTAKLFREMGVKASVEELVARMDEYAGDKYRNVILLKPHVEEYLRYLHGQGARLFVLTASPQRMSVPCLRRNGVLELFEKVWSTDDFKLGKNGPEIYLAAAREIGCGVEDIVFYDDNRNALTGANAAGVETVAVYDSFSAEDEPELRKICGKYWRVMGEE